MNKLIFEELVKDLSNQTIFVLLLGGNLMLYRYSKYPSEQIFKLSV